MDKGKIYNALTFPRRKIASLIDTPAVVLLYHRVKSLPTDPLQLAVTPHHFEEHIKYLRSAYNLITPEEFFFSKKNKKKFSEKTVLITFDDGYEDNCNEALPVLEQYKAQALFFITTSNLNTACENWWDDLERIFLEGENFPSELKINGENEIRFKTFSLEDRRNAYWSLQPILKFTKPSQRDDIMRQLHLWKGISDEGRPTHRMMTTDELKKMADSESAFIGAHTHSHASLGCLAFEEQLSEIKKSKEVLEKLTGKKINHLAYPFGTRKDFNNHTVKVCENLDIEFAFANYYGQVHRWTNNYRIPRMLVRDWDLETFKKKMNSFFNY